MHSIQFLSAILKGNWLNEPNFAFAQGSLIAFFINRQTEFTPEILNPFTAFAVDAKDINGEKYNNKEGFIGASQNSVAVISVKGVLMKEDMVCGPAGTATLGRIIQQADSNPNISAIVLHIDSPGGNRRRNRSPGQHYQKYKQTRGRFCRWTDGQRCPLDWFCFQ